MRPNVKCSTCPKVALLQAGRHLADIGRRPPDYADSSRSSNCGPHVGGCSRPPRRQDCHDVSADLEPLRRVAAYAICTDEAGRLLLVRESARSGMPGVWTLPGGGVLHGEHPELTVARETAEEAGLGVGTERLVDVVADVRTLPGEGVTLHTDRLIYEAAVTGVRGEPSSPKVDEARWVTRREAAGLQLRPFVANALKLPLTAVDLPPEQLPD